MMTDKRQCRRYPMSDEPETAILEVGRREYPLRLVDVSAEGFGAEFDGDLELEIGRELMMLSPAGWHRVRVVRCRSTFDGTNLGFARLADVEAKIDLRERVRRARSEKRTRHPASILSGFVLLAVAAAVTLTYFPATWRLLGHYFGR